MEAAAVAVRQAAVKEPYTQTRLTLWKSQSGLPQWWQHEDSTLLLEPCGSHQLVAYLVPLGQTHLVAAAAVVQVVEASPTARLQLSALLEG